MSNKKKNDKKINYFEILNGEIKELKNKIHPWNSNDNNLKEKSKKEFEYVVEMIVKKLHNYKPIKKEPITPKTSTIRYILEKNNKFLDVLFQKAGKGGEKRLKSSKTSIPDLSKWLNTNKSHKKILVSIYAPLFYDDIKLEIEKAKLIYCFVPEEKIVRKYTKNNTSRWSDIDSLKEIYDEYNNKDKIIKNSEENVFIANESSFINFIEKEFDNEDFISNDNLVRYIKFLESDNKYDLYKENNYLKINNAIRQKFKNDLLKKNIQIKCEFPFCQNNYEDCLIGSHIYAVADIAKVKKIDDNEKIKMIKDCNNGLLLCPNHDHLFDRHLITFDKNGVMKISKKLMPYLNSFNIDINNYVYQIEIDKKKEFYMEFHRKEFNKQNK